MTYKWCYITIGHGISNGSIYEIGEKCDPVTTELAVA